MSDSEASGLGNAFASTEPSQSGPEVFLVTYSSKSIFLLMLLLLLIDQSTTVENLLLYSVDGLLRVSCNATVI